MLSSQAIPLAVTKTPWDRSEESWNLTLFLVASSSPWQRVYWFNYLKVMPVFVCVPPSPFSVLSLSTTYISLPTLPFSQSRFPSIHVSVRRDPLLLLSCRHLTFITAWPWLSLLSSLLWCSITLSSWGKHWCQATVMTFWLSVFMWWMRWKCTTAAKRGLASCQAATPQSGRTGAGRRKQQNK